MRLPKAAIFDMDGLMLDTEVLSLKAIRQACKILQLKVDEQWFYDIIGMNAAGANHYLESRLGHKLPDDLDATYSKLYKEQLNRGIKLKSGLIELLKFLDDHAIRRAVATSTRTDMALKKLSMTGIDHWFETIVCGDQVENGKPAPDIYLKAAARLDIEPSNCIALEDSDNGAMAAHAAGMHLFVVPDLKAPRELTVKIADHMMTDLFTVRDYLSRLATIETPQKAS